MSRLMQPPPTPSSCILLPRPTNLQTAIKAPAMTRRITQVWARSTRSLLHVCPRSSVVAISLPLGLLPARRKHCFNMLPHFVCLTQEVRSLAPSTLLAGLAAAQLAMLPGELAPQLAGRLCEARCGESASASCLAVSAISLNAAHHSRFVTRNSPLLKHLPCGMWHAGAALADEAAPAPAPAAADAPAKPAAPAPAAVVAAAPAVKDEAPPKPAAAEAPAAPAQAPDATTAAAPAPKPVAVVAQAPVPKPQEQPKPSAIVAAAAEAAAAAAKTADEVAVMADAPSDVLQLKFSFVCSVEVKDVKAGAKPVVLEPKCTQQPA